MSTDTSSRIAGSHDPTEPLNAGSQPSVTPAGLRAREITLIVISVGLITLAHFLVGRATHPQHIIHIILGGTYLLPIVAAALFFGTGGAVTVTAIITALYYTHMRISWPHQPMENANQLGMLAVYWFMATVSGVLVDLRERERTRHLQAERRSEREAVFESIAGLASALKARDEYTRAHSVHVSRLATEIARRRGLPADRVDLARLAGLVHDVGKIGVRDDVLWKPDALSKEQRAAMERHPQLAADILRPIRGARGIAEIVLAHHECPDGSGYPLGRRAEQIPLEAHIVRVADVFSSLTEQRSYKPALATAQALEVMDAMAGSKLDAESFRVLKQILAEQDRRSDVPALTDRHQ